MLECWTRWRGYSLDAMFRSLVSACSCLQQSPRYLIMGRLKIYTTGCFRQLHLDIIDKVRTLIVRHDDNTNPAF